MDADALLVALRREGTAFAAAVPDALDHEIVGCPDWAGSDLVGHLCRVYHWVSGIVRTGERQEAVTPELERDEMVSTYLAELANLESAFREAGPEKPVWTFGASKDDRVLWWYRRQALETAVHRWDLEAAGAGSVETVAGVAPELAVAGIEEYMFDILPRVLRRPVPGIEGTLHLHCTDVDGEWFIDLSSQRPVAEHRHAKADTAIRGPASGLYLWLFNRLDAEQAGLATFGPDQVPAAWTSIHV